jgi:signal transduction histidine kinase
LTISREIHEELGQQLAVLKIDLSRLGKKILPLERDLSADMDELSASITKMIETVRKISFELRPGMLDDIGLMATLDWYC